MFWTKVASALEWLNIYPSRQVQGKRAGTWLISQANEINPFIYVATKATDNLDDISLAKTIFKNYLKENCSSELYLGLFFKYFANLCFFPKLFSKVWQVQTTLVDQVDVYAADVIGLKKNVIESFWTCYFHL